LPEVLSSENEEHRLATNIIVFSSFTKRTLVLNGVDAEKIIINPLGVNLQLFHPPSTPRKYKVIRFLFLGSISLQKGAPLLLEAWKKLALDRAELWIVGSPPKHVQLSIHSLCNVKITGRVPNTQLPKLLRRCDVLVLPSYAEGFGLVLLEALASGLPIITTDVTAAPDLIQDGIEGQVITYGNLDALCKAIISFIDVPDRLAKMSAAARVCAEKYSWDNYGDRWKHILEKYA
jgi:glycosyltransferase involved in cell wall biosynthesis